MQSKCCIFCLFFRHVKVACSCVNKNLRFVLTCWANCVFKGFLSSPAFSIGLTMLSLGLNLNEHENQSGASHAHRPMQITLWYVEIRPKLSRLEISDNATITMLSAHQSNSTRRGIINSQQIWPWEISIISLPIKLWSVTHHASEMFYQLQLLTYLHVLDLENQPNTIYINTTYF